MIIPALTSGVDQKLLLAVVLVAAFAVIGYAFYLKHKQEHSAEVPRFY
jgi:Tfp pilus assembly protein PilO